MTTVLLLQRGELEMRKAVPIDEYREHYFVSDAGEVYSNHRNRLLTPKLSKAGYYRITLCNGKHQTIGVHRLVALAFLENPDGKPTVNHLNEVKTDNRVENLAWATTAEQNAHGTRTKRAMANTDWKERTKKMDYAEIAQKHDYGREDMCNRKRTAVILNGEVKGVFKTQREAAKYIGVSTGRLSSCLSAKEKCKGYDVCREDEIEEFCIAVTKKHFGEEKDEGTEDYG